MQNITALDLHKLSEMSASLQQEAADQNRTEEALRHADDRLHAVMEAVPGHVAWINIDLTYLGANHNLASTFNLAPEAFIGQPVGSIHGSAGFTEFVRQFFASPNHSASQEIETEVNSMPRSYLVVAHKYLEGEAAVFVGIDITDRKVMEEQLRHNALHDGLTGLPNRTLFRDRLEHAFEKAKRQQQHRYAVLFLDLDGFKIVNDSLGHAAGDRLLIIMARRLEACLRPGDTVARLGGDEFAILLEDTSNISDAVQVAERIQQDLSPPVNLCGQDIYTTASIGIALASESYQHTGDLLRDADVAMYRAKASGKARHEVFTAAMRTEVVERLQWETELRRGIERGEFELLYQPIVSLASNRIAGLEALVRWRHPQRGLLQPKDFMPMAEQTGLIVALDQWVLQEACRQMQRWMHNAPEESALTMSVNISCRYFAHADLSSQIESILRQTSLPPHNLKLEIKERALIEDADSSAVTLAQLRRQGIRLSMDDFGTGYSSLSYLHDFALDTLKIDRSLVQRLCAVNGSLEIIRGIILLMHSLGKEVIIEGVETAQQLLQLRHLKCQYVQGFFFSTPVNGEAAGLLIEQDKLPQDASAPVGLVDGHLDSNRGEVTSLLFAPDKSALTLVG